METNQVTYSNKNVPEYLLPYVELEDVVFDEKIVSTDKIKEILSKYSCFSDNFVKYLLVTAYKVRPFSYPIYNQILADFQVSDVDIRNLSVLQSSDRTRFLFGAIDYSIKYPIFPIDSIFHAAVNNDVDKVVFMSSTVDVTTITENYDSKEITLIDAAAFAGAVGVFKYLSINGCSITLTTAEYSIKGGNEEIISLIVQAGISFSYLEEIAIQYHRQDIATWIISNYESNLIQYSKLVTYFNTIALCYYIAKGGQGINGLHNAVKVHSLGYTHILVANGADIEWQNKNELIPTVLNFAASQNDEDIVKFLIENNASLTERNGHNETVLMQTILNKNLDLVKYIVERNVNLEDIVPYNGMTALMYCAKVDFPEAIKYLVSKGANIDQQNKDGDTALIIASSKRHFESMKALIECGANIEIHDKQGFTALSLACYNEYLDSAQILIDHGADINAHDQNGKTILMVSASNLRAQSVKFLVEKGADKTLKDNNGKTVYDYSSERIKRCLD